jgi:hypothetical protein
MRTEKIVWHISVLLILFFGTQIIHGYLLQLQASQAKPMPTSKFGAHGSRLWSFGVPIRDPATITECQVDIFIETGHETSYCHLAWSSDSFLWRMCITTFFLFGPSDSELWGESSWQFSSFAEHAGTCGFRSFWPADRSFTRKSIPQIF